MNTPLQLQEWKIKTSCNFNLKSRSVRVLTHIQFCPIDIEQLWHRNYIWIWHSITFPYRNWNALFIISLFSRSTHELFDVNDWRGLFMYCCCCCCCLTYPMLEFSLIDERLMDVKINTLRGKYNYFGLVI